MLVEILRSHWKSLSGWDFGIYSIILGRTTCSFPFSTRNFNFWRTSHHLGSFHLTYFSRFHTLDGSGLDTDNLHLRHLNIKEANRCINNQLTESMSAINKRYISTLLTPMLQTLLQSTYFWLNFQSPMP